MEEARENKPITTEEPNAMFVHMIRSGVTLYNLKKNIVQITSETTDKNKSIKVKIGFDKGEGAKRV